MKIGSTMDKTGLDTFNVLSIVYRDEKWINFG
jgi:hypothetical protein